jgi:hypothetical protein
MVKNDFINLREKTLNDVYFTMTKNKFVPEEEFLIPKIVVPK